MTFKIDLHVHTRHSGDSEAEPEDMVRKAISRGLQGIAFTEHYSYEASEYADRLRLMYGGSIEIFRGVEFSAAEGHCLVFGVDTDRLSLKGAPADELVREVKGMGGVVIPAHPYRRGSGMVDLVRSIQGISAIEGYNGANLHGMNVLAMAVARSRGLPAIGGSDAHAPEEVGSCYTEFRCEVSSENFLDALKAGAYGARDVRKISRWSGFP